VLGGHPGGPLLSGPLPLTSCPIHQARQRDGVRGTPRQGAAAPSRRRPVGAGWRSPVAPPRVRRGGSAPAGEAAAESAARGPPPVRRAQVSSSYSATSVVAASAVGRVRSQRRNEEGADDHVQREGRVRAAPTPAAAPTANPQQPPGDAAPSAGSRGQTRAARCARRRDRARAGSARRASPRGRVRSGSSLGGDRGKPSVQKRPRKPKARPNVAVADYRHRAPLGGASQTHLRIRQGKRGAARRQAERPRRRPVRRLALTPSPSGCGSFACRFGRRRQLDG
jgi:hypothetical protein